MEKLFKSAAVKPAVFGITTLLFAIYIGETTDHPLVSESQFYAIMILGGIMDVFLFAVWMVSIRIEKNKKIQSEPIEWLEQDTLDYYGREVDISLCPLQRPFKVGEQFPYEELPKVAPFRFNKGVGKNKEDRQIEVWNIVRKNADIFPDGFYASFINHDGECFFVTFEIAGRECEHIAVSPYDPNQLLTPHKNRRLILRLPEPVSEAA